MLSRCGWKDDEATAGDTHEGKNSDLREEDWNETMYGRTYR